MRASVRPTSVILMSLVSVTCLPAHMDATPVSNGLVLWLDATDLHTIRDADGRTPLSNDFAGRVATWLDKSPNHFDAGQHEMDGQPRFRLEAIGGRPSVEFDGFNDALGIGPTLDFGSSLTIYAVAQLRGTSSARREPLFAGWGNPGSVELWLGGDEGPVLSQSFTTRIMPTQFDDRARVPLGFGVSYDGANAAFFLNGLHESRPYELANNDWSPDAYWVGRTRWVHGVFEGATLDGSISELFVYDRGLDQNERREVEDYLTVKYELPFGVPDPTPVLWSTEEGGNGHAYQLVLHDFGPVGWHEARAEAETMQFMGVFGHLATITSQAEQDFIAAQFPHTPDIYLGGFQDPSAPDYSEPAGGWRWVTGEPWEYTNWQNNEPNNCTCFGLPEEFLHSGHAGWPKWNDNHDVALSGLEHFRGYLVEFPVSSLLAGDYNGNGRVEQADLDLVLLNWGAIAYPSPVGWQVDLPAGLIDQNELDGVLLNWGNGAALTTSRASSVPEPGGLLLLAISTAVACALCMLAMAQRMGISSHAILPCMPRSILCLLAVAHVNVESASSQTVFDAAPDFTIGNNPNGTWSYGWSEGLGTTVHLFTELQFFDQLVRLGGGGDFANVHYNTSGKTVIAGPTYPPHALTFHPGASGQFGVVRWTAPDDGGVQFDATFTGIHGTTTDIHILHNGSSLFAGEIQGFGESISFSSSPTNALLPVNLGDVVDFAVGFGFDGNYEEDTTQIDAHIYFFSSLAGDYNRNGRVEQADLDLVLLNWGADAFPPPPNWLLDLPTGLIDQNELDSVLLNWASVGAPLGRGVTSPVQEPPVLQLAFVIALAIIVRRSALIS